MKICGGNVFGTLGIGNQIESAELHEIELNDIEIIQNFERLKVNKNKIIKKINKNKNKNKNKK